jgi:hypothetical protein
MNPQIIIMCMYLQGHAQTGKQAAWTKPIYQSFMKSKRACVSCSFLSDPSRTRTVEPVPAGMFGLFGYRNGQLYDSLSGTL